MQIDVRLNSLVALVLVLGGCDGDSSGAGGGGTTPSNAELLYTPTSLVLELEVDAQNLYFVEGGEFWRLPHEGGSPTMVADVVADTFAMDDTHAYFPHGISGTIEKAPKAGGDPTEIVSGEKEPTTIAVDDSGLYWGNWSSWSDGGAVADGSIVRADKDGSNVTVLADNLVYPRSLALDDASVYWASGNLNQILKVAKSGGTPVVLADDQYDPRSVVVDDTGVYWRTGSQYSNGNDVPSQIVKVDKDGGVPVVLATGKDIYELAVDGGTIVFSDGNGGASCSHPQGQIAAVPTAGGSPTPLVASRYQPGELALNATHVFWVDGTASSSQCQAMSKAPR